MDTSSIRPRYFRNESALRTWFEKHYKTHTEFWIGFYKVGSGRISISWPQSVDQALCFGWIDGIRKTLNAESYMIRFTSRKPGSIWSAVNIKKAETLIAAGLMFPEGLAAFERRKAEKSAVYSFEQKNIAFSAEFEKIFKKNKNAWTYFSKQAPWYRRTATWWVNSAKQEVTRMRRLQILMTDSANGVLLKQLRRS
jgi:uncharacterized protein YdeI (YjbR/CyaY-like superfamily)